jgi:hypothetical protein
MKQTAVEWQHIELMRINFEYGTMKISPREFQEQIKDILDKAKEMEKEQKKDAYLRGIANYDETFKTK